MSTSEPDHSAGPLSPEQLVRARLAQQRLFEARFLIGRVGPDMEPAVVSRLEKHIHATIKKVNALVAQAEDLLAQGRVDDALVVYKQVRSLAIDYPDLDKILQELRIRRSLGPLPGGRGDANRRKPVEPAQPEAADMVERQRPEKHDVGVIRKKTSRKFVFGGVAFLFVLAAFGAVFFQMATNTGSMTGRHAGEKQADPLDRSMPSGPAFPEESRKPPGQRPLLPKEIMTAPITDSLPMPGMVERKNESDGQRQKALEKGQDSMGPLPVFIAGQHQISVRFVPSENEAETGDSDPDSTPESGLKEKQTVGSSPSLPSSPLPAGEDRAARDPEVRSDRYTVQEGDSLKTIAERIYGRPERWFCLVQANGELLPHSPYRIAPGMQLSVPSEEHCRKLAQSRTLNPDGTYTVQSGDNLGKISSKFYGTSRRWMEIFDNNRDILPTPASLRVGQRLKIRFDQEQDVKESESDAVGMGGSVDKTGDSDQDH